MGIFRLSPVDREAPIPVIRRARQPRRRSPDPGMNMTAPAPTGFLSTEFDPFLSSPLWLDRNEFPLSVMSALARLDIDPWQEAAALAAALIGASVLPRFFDRPAVPAATTVVHRGSGAVIQGFTTSKD